MNEITIHDVKNILKDKVKQTYKHIHHYANDTNKYDEEELNERIHQSSEKERELKEKLKSNYKETVGKFENEIDRILNSRDLETDKNNVDYKGLVSKWTDLKLIRETWKKELLEGQGRYEEEYLKELEDNWKIGLLDKETKRTPIVKTEVVEPIVNNESEVSSPLFSEMYNKHIQRLRDNKRREETIKETIETYKDVIELLGDKPISEYTILDGRDYRNSLLKTPKNRKRIKKYRNKNIHELLSMEIPTEDKMSFDNQTKLISRMTSCWNFLIDEYPEYVTENVFKSKSIRINPVRRKDRKQHFTEDELRHIFNPKTYLPFIFNNSSGRITNIHYPYYWIPILAVLTGCRLEELCMMRVKDITKEKGVLIYRIREDDGETKVKNSYSERDIPLHSVLIDTLDFVGYVNRMKKLKHKRVFHELPMRGSVYHKNVGRFFNDKYLKKIGVKDGERKVSFHSFRHNVETFLTNQNVNPRFIDFLQGHSQKGMGGNVYMKGINSEVLLKECVDKIQFDIDWEELKIKW
ncbi:site-specific integrase [Deltaproteobacteria bacterium]|nr:site-specific integrase [Deltaproteobacteria bacterium]